MASIGNLAVFLSANSAQLEADLKLAGDKVKGFVDSIKTTLAGVAVIGLGQQLFSQALAMADKYADKLTALDAQAKKLGTTMTEAAAIDRFAGASSEELTHGLVHLN